MLKKSFIAGLLLLALVAIPLSSSAQTPAVTNGLNWLSSTQTIEGNWPGVATEELVATATATEALLLLNPVAPGYGQGVQWLEGHPASPTDLLARRIVTLTRAGRSTTAEVAQMLALRDGSGGWGGDDGFLLTSLDTALALQALKAANYPDLSVNIAALAWLTNSQNPDGGWGFAKGGNSNVAMTAVAAATLQQFPQTATIATALNKAASYLIAHENLDGGFGVTPGDAPASSIHETALASIALAGSGQGEWGPQQNALTYLTSNQALNGSWNDDPYTTALALTALYLAEHKPTPPPPPSTTGSMIGTVVDAATQLPLSGVSAVLVSNPTFTASTDANGLFALSGLPNGVQQIAISAAGYAPLTITVSITADSFINTGSIGLTVNPTTGTIMGIVWDLDENAPYPGVTVSAIINNNIMQSYQTLSGADGSFKITDVPPGNVVVGTPTGPKAGYWNVQMTGTLAPGGILIYNPRMSKTPPPFVNMYIQSEKAIYRKGDTVPLAVTIQNNRSSAYQAVLRLSVTDPSGSTVFDSSKVVTLDAKGRLTQEENFTLPLDAQGGFYSAKAELSNGNAEIIGSATTSFGLLRSEIAVTPTLPASFALGVNTITFNLSNSGAVAVASGVLDLTLIDPDGEVLTSAAQDFTLGQGENKNIAFPVSIPALKFGNYILSYTQRDETTDGTPVTISLPSSVEISSLFDKVAYRIGEKANLLVTVKNTGKFALDTVTVNVSAVDAGFAETRLITLGGESVLSLPYALPLLADLTAGDHQATVTLTLPGGTSVTRDCIFTILPSLLALSLGESSSAAGSVISPTLTNSGGVDTQVQYTLRLYDADGMQLAERSGTETVGIGATLALALAIPDGAVEGDYNLVVNFKDLESGKEEIVPNPIFISGVQGTLQVQTDKEEYLTTEGITALSGITNTGTALQGGNLHLQVTTAAGNQKQKTWTSQYDFQQGVRNGVDTYGVNDWLIPDDDFNQAGMAPQKWEYSSTVNIQSGAMVMTRTSGDPLVQGKWKLTGDFDIQVDFDFSKGGGIPGPEMGIGSPSFWVYLSKTSDGFYSGASVRGQWVASYSKSDNSTTGRLRFVRSSSTVSTYYWSGSGWVEMLRHTDGALAENTNVVLRIYGNMSFKTTSAAFDNFKVNSGRILAQNETVNSVRLLPVHDNFDDSLVNSDRWIIRRQLGNNGLATEGTGKIHLSINEGVQYEHVETLNRVPLTGDFDVQVDWSNFSTKVSKGTGMILYISSKSSDSSAFIQRGLDSSDHFSRDVRVNGTWRRFSRIPTAQTSGKLRIVRSGSLISTFYNDASGWVRLGDAVAFPTGPAEAYLDLELGASGGSVSGDFNNFQMMNRGKYTTGGTLRTRHDAGLTSKWSLLTWSAAEPAGTDIRFRTRTATDEAGLASATWSDYLTAIDSPITSPPGRWIEVEATLETADTNVTPLLHDVTVTYGHDPGDIIWQTDVPVNLAQNALSELHNTVGTLGAAGKYYLQGILTSSTGQTVATSESPFYVIQGEMLLNINSNQKIYKPGETVTITGNVQNLATVEAANLSFTVKSQPIGGVAEILTSGTLTIPAGGSHPFTITTTAGADGTVTLTAVVTQNGSTLAEMADQYEVASPMVSATLSGPETVGGAPFALSLTLTNSGKTDATVMVANSFNSTTETLSIPTGETTLRHYPQQISAETLYTFTMSGDLNQTLTKLVSYAAPAVASVNATVVTDKVAYNPQESVILSSTITASVSIENPSAWIRISDSQGQDLYSERVNLPSLIQGQTFTLNKLWNSATYPAGTYQVSLQVYNSSGSVLATAHCTLTLNAPTNPKSLLRGEVTLDQQHILTGEPLAVSYRITNVGNVDLTRIDLEIRIVGAVDQSVCSAITDQTALAIGEVSAKSGQIDTHGYSAKDYLVLLLAKIDGVEEVLAGTYFRVEGAPSVPARIGPENGADVASFTPALKISNAADPNADRLTYEFEIYTDSGLTTLVVSGTAPETVSSTLWNVTTPLAENQTYYWRARAYDGRLYGPWLEVASFRVNTVNDLPTAPQISSPADGTSTVEFTPTLSVSTSADPDSPILVYHFVLARDPDFTQVVASESGIPSGETMTAWPVPLPLEENGWYYWRVQADDLLAVGPWSATAKFLVNSANDPPTTPVIIAPAANSVLAAESTDVVVSNSTDPDSPILSYYFEADTTVTFDSAELLRSAMVIEGQETTLWSLTGLLENTGYFLRAKATDGMAESSWSEVVGFFVNAVNEPPTAPVLDNPSDGSGVNLLTPTLSVRNATDPDRDPLTYEFAVYTDAALTSLAVRTDNIAPSPEATAWAIPWALTENQTYYWQARASDGLLSSDWMPPASFMINTANDAPGAPQLSAPADGMSVETLTPVLTVVNALDPDSDQLTYDFEFYSSGILIAAFSKVAEGTSGTTSVTLDQPLTDGNTYSWRVRAFDGDLYGPWMTMANFSIPKTTISVEIKFEPETLNKRAEGQWVQVMIELPHGYKAADIDLSSIRLEGTIPAEPRPLSMQRGEDTERLTVKFKRSQVIAALPVGNHIPVRATGKVGSTAFAGEDFIRVLDYKTDKDER